MSIRVMSAVWSDMRIRSQAELLLLLALADHARDDGVCWPSMRSIAAKARVDERSARRIVRRLAERGLITIIEQGGCDEDGRNVPNRYRVLAGETRQADGGTLCPPGGTVSQGIRGDRESPRGDSEDTDGGAYGPPEGAYGPPKRHNNHQREPSTTTTTRARSNSAEASSSCGSVFRGNEEEAATGLAQVLATEFRLSGKQRQVVAEYCESHGAAYLEEKAEIVRRQPCRNAAGAFLAALREDWQLPVNSKANDDMAQMMGWEL